MRAPILIAAVLLATTAQAQWTLLNSGSTADFRGIHNVGNGVVWVSGTQGTVLRSTDNGSHWQHCATPPNAEKLDFRAIQGFDASSAIVMSSGSGDASRLYRTTDGCQTWTLLLTNPDKDGFWDGFRLTYKSGLLVGDPIDGKFPLTWIVPDQTPPNNFEEHVPARRNEAAFAASNSSTFVYSNIFWLATGGPGGARVLRKVTHGGDGIGWVSYYSSEVPIGQHTDSSGIFSLVFAVPANARPSEVRTGIAVGGDYRNPDVSASTAAFTKDSGKTWTASSTPPQGYRSAVAYDTATETWITVGPNGTDISTDDGRNWHALTPSATEPSDADKQWNALSLPFVAGPHGRIGMLDPSALEH